MQGVARPATEATRIEWLRGSVLPCQKIVTRRQIRQCQRHPTALVSIGHRYAYVTSRMCRAPTKLSMSQRKYSACKACNTRFADKGSALCTCLAEPERKHVSEGFKCSLWLKWFQHWSYLFERLSHFVILSLRGSASNPSLSLLQLFLPILCLVLNDTVTYAAVTGIYPSRMH